MGTYPSKPDLPAIIRDLQRRLHAVERSTVVLVSPDGTRWHLAVANDGTLSAVEIP